jgi:hypothetical protein
MLYASKKIILHTFLFLIFQHLYSNDSIIFAKITESMEQKIGPVDTIKAVVIIATLAGTESITAELKNKINKGIKPKSEIAASEEALLNNEKAVLKKFPWKCAIKKSALKTLLTSTILIV